MEIKEIRKAIGWRIKNLESIIKMIEETPEDSFVNDVARQNCMKSLKQYEFAIKELKAKVSA